MSIAIVAILEQLSAWQKNAIGREIGFVVH